MGDSGSLFIGFVLATLSLGGSAAKATTAVSLLVPILAMGLPITDTLCAIIRRYLERRPLFSADTGHIHHRLLQLGLTQRRAVLILYGTSLVFTAAAILVYLGRAWQIALALGVSSLVIVGLVRGVKLFQPISVHIDERPTICAECARRFRYSVPEYLKNIDEANDLVSLMNSILLFCKNAHIEKFKCQSTGLDGFGAWTWNGGRNDSDLPSNPGAINSSSNFVFSLENGISGTVEFHWFSESEKLSPAAEIMLQIVVDAFERRLKHITLSSSSDRDSDHSEKRDFHSQCTQMSE
jgi:UDP-GlcNAc:undecaprenyl-phosphate GlcNAc-1-phosphate transferase